ncbi:MAG: T9SS type A sorting domain-containing protein, partial [Bacteroidales bacterium]
NPVAGTGNELSFGFQPTGNYTVTAINGSCAATMQGTATVFLIDPVAAASQPTGPTTVCSNVPATFNATLPANGFTLVWTLVPASAGTITQPSTTTASISWNSGFSGAVAITVQGQNECGTGATSPALNVILNATPVPAITGISTVCKTQSINYTTTLNTGSSYAWTVTGGTITSGQGSNQVTVLWGNPGNGTLTVSETTVANCEVTSPVFAVSINACTGTEDDKADGFNIYPNPASNILNFRMGTKAKMNVSIYNQFGQVVYHSDNVKATGSGEARIDISKLNAGSYTFRALSEDLVFEKIFVKK